MGSTIGIMDTSQAVSKGSSLYQHVPMLDKIKSYSKNPESVKNGFSYPNLPITVGSTACIGGGIQKIHDNNQGFSDLKKERKIFYLKIEPIF